MRHISQAEIEAMKKLLHNVTHGLKYRINGIVRGTGLTFPQALVLKAIQKSDTPPTLTDVSHKVGLAINTVSDIVQRLERNGLLIREEDSTDARALRLRMTNEAQNLLNTVTQEYDSFIRESLSNFNDDEVVIFLSLLERFNHYLNISIEQ